MNDVIRYRREKAKQVLKDALLLAEKGSLLSAVNRIYYACFYEVSALLLAKGLSSPKHTGIRSLFNKNFVKTGIIPNAMGEFYGKMFEFRHEGDYLDFVKFDAKEVKSWANKTKEFIETIEKHIK